MSISVIVPSYRNPLYLDLCLKSIVENKTLSSTEIVVVVDGYPSESIDVLNKYPGVNVLTFDENVGMANAINAGVFQASSNYVFIVNDDQVFPRNWDGRLEKAINTIEQRCEHDKWVLTVNQVEPVGPGMYNFPVRNLGQSTETFQYDEWLKHEESIVENYITTTGHIFPLVVQKKWYMAIGGMDGVTYHSPQVVDYDMFLKWELFSFRFYRTYALHLYHFGSVVTRKGPEARKFREQEAKAYIEYKWKWGIELYNKPSDNGKIPPNGQFRGFSV